MYFWERTGMIEADSSQAFGKACQYELKTDSTKERSPTELRCASSPARLSVTWGAVKGQDERPLFGGALDSSPRHHTGGLCRWKPINKVGRHVGLDFYDLLIEGHNAHRELAHIRPGSKSVMAIFRQPPSKLSGFCESTQGWLCGSRVPVPPLAE
jgi:hypothetical protein